MAPPHDFVNCSWFGGQTFDDRRQGSGRVDIEYQAGFCVWGIPVFTMGCRPFEHRVHNFQNVVDVSDQCGPLADQSIGTIGARIQRRTGNGKDLATLFAGHPRGDQRAGTLGGFHDHHGQRKARDNAVAAREVARLWFEPGRHVTDDGAGRPDLMIQGLVLGRVNDVDAPGQDRDGGSRSGEGAVMGRGIDATGEPGIDGDIPRAGQITSQCLGKPPAVR